MQHSDFMYPSYPSQQSSDYGREDVLRRVV